MKIAVTFLIAALGICAVADARVYSLRPTQSFAFPNPDNSFDAPKIAIDGDSFIVLVRREGGRSALLYRRGADGTWAFSRTLLDVDGGDIFAADVEMAPGLAAVRLDDLLHIYERLGGEWVESATAGTPRAAPGLAISGQRIVAGRLGCNYDADVYEKSLGSGVWRINGRISGESGECTDHGVEIDLDGDVALVRNPSSEVREYRRSGTTWPQVGSFAPPAGVSLGSGPLALRGATAVAAGGATFARSGGAWSFIDRIRPLNYGDGAGNVGTPEFRDGVLHTDDSSSHRNDETDVYLYRESAAGRFEHVAVLNTFGQFASHDVSGNTAVAGSVGLFAGDFYVDVFTLPSPIVAPPAIANDFDAQDISGFQQTAGSQFALAASGNNTVYRQSSLAGESHAFLTNSDWSTQQYIEADITPTAFDGNDRWFGIATRYIDAANFYYVTLRGSNRVQLKRMSNGVFTTLADAPLPVTLNRTYHVQLIADGKFLSVHVDGVRRALVSDTTHTHGRAALMTYRTRADFDNVFAGSTLPFNLTYADFTNWNDEGPRPFTRIGGTWTPVEDENSGNIIGEAQTSTAGDARAFTGAPTDDQEVEMPIRLDQWGTSPSGTWFGLLARYVDAGTHYYLSVRSTGQLQIRKQVNGAITVLRSVPFTVSPGEFHVYKLVVTGNQLHAYVDGVFRAGALDNSIPRGQYGFGMYRAAATFQTFSAVQP